MEFFEYLDILGAHGKEIPCVTGASAPTSTTEGDIGCLYMDTDTGELYKCIAAVDGVLTWEPAVSKLVMGATVVTEDGTLEINVPEGAAIKTGTQICYRNPAVTGEPIAEINSNYTTINGERYLFVTADNRNIDAKELHEKNDTIIIRIDETVGDSLFVQVIAVVPKEQKTVEVTAESIEDALGYTPANKAILYDQEQTLTDAEKKQARDNIGAMSSDVNIEGAVLYTQQTLTDEQKAQARANIGIEADGSVIAVDTTLSMPGVAADAKAVGDAFDFTGVAGVNLLDPSKFLLDMVFNKNTLEWSYYSGGGQVLSDYIHLPVGTVVTFLGNEANGTYNKQSTRYITAHDTNDNVVEYVEYKDKYTLPETAVKIRVAFGKKYLADNGGANMLVIGDYDSYTAPPYEPYKETKISGIKVYSENVVGFEPLKEDLQKVKYNFRKVDAVCDQYSNEAVLDIAWSDNARAYFSAVYGVYDDLCAAYPNYVTKRELPLHTVDLGDGKEPIDVWCYDFTPPTPVGSNAELCKIFYCSGTHGGEATPPIIGARFFKDLCENWKSQDLLRPLRFNCKFTVIPMVNPYGFANGTKNNERGVNLNRNFSKGWVSKEGSGSSAASETITQVIESMIATEGYNFCLDHHTYGYFNSEPNELKIGYCCSCKQRPEDVSCAEMIGFWANGKAVAETTSLDSSQTYFKQIITSEYAGQMFDAFTHGYCFETMGGWGYDDAGKALEAEYPSQKLGAEVLGTMLYSAFVGYHSY